MTFFKVLFVANVRTKLSERAWSVQKLAVRQLPQVGEILTHEVDGRQVKVRVIRVQKDEGSPDIDFLAECNEVTRDLAELLLKAGWGQRDGRLLPPGFGRMN